MLMMMPMIALMMMLMMMVVVMTLVTMMMVMRRCRYEEMRVELHGLSLARAAQVRYHVLHELIIDDGERRRVIAREIERRVAIANLVRRARHRAQILRLDDEAIDGQYVNDDSRIAIDRQHIAVG